MMGTVSKLNLTRINYETVLFPRHCEEGVPDKLKTLQNRVLKLGKDLMTLHKVSIQHPDRTSLESVGYIDLESYIRLMMMHPQYSRLILEANQNWSQPFMRYLLDHGIDEGWTSWKERWMLDDDHRPVSTPSTGIMWYQTIKDTYNCWSRYTVGNMSSSEIYVLPKTFYVDQFLLTYYLPH